MNDGIVGNAYNAHYHDRSKDRSRSRHKPKHTQQSEDEHIEYKGQKEHR
jgi:hypothetical protein